MKKGSEKGGVKGSKKGIKHVLEGRHLENTEHHGRMSHELGTHDAFPGGGSHDSEGSSYDGSY